MIKIIFSLLIIANFYHHFQVFFLIEINILATSFSQVVHNSQKSRSRKLFCNQIVSRKTCDGYF